MCGSDSPADSRAFVKSRTDLLVFCASFAPVSWSTGTGELETALLARLERWKRRLHRMQRRTDACARKNGIVIECGMDPVDMRKSVAFCEGIEVKLRTNAVVRMAKTLMSAQRCRWQGRCIEIEVEVILGDAIKTEVVVLCADRVIEIGFGVDVITKNLQN